MTTLSPGYCLTIGDPTGIGPEITAKLLAMPNFGLSSFGRLFVLGDIDHLARTASSLNLNLPKESEQLHYLDVPASTPGKIAYGALVKAVELIHIDQAQGMVTGPISKANLQASNLNYSGHTEILESLARQYYPGQPHQADMLFLFQQFRLLLLTRHVALRRVGDTLTIPAVEQSLLGLIYFLKNHLHIATPKLCMLGVNPHAGEVDGLEERTILEPAMALVHEKTGAIISPPGPADAIFRGFDANNPPFDAYIAAYHDQGLIPMKLVAGLRAVNVTIGLPFLRTSVSHGIAPDIVGRGIADPVSLVEALHCLQRLSP